MDLVTFLLRLLRCFHVDAYGSVRGPQAEPEDESLAVPEGAD
jgi:hypothetical protein